MPTAATVTLWRPVGPAELELIKQSGMRAFPPRLPIRAEDLNAFNAAIVGKIRVTASFL